jgi:transposase
MRTHTTYTSWHEGCRFRVYELFTRGWTQTAIAAVLGLSQSGVSKILKKAQEQGVDSLHTHTAPGRPPQVSPRQVEELRTLLTQGATAHGFVGNVWTSPRVATLLERHFGIHLSDRQVLRILHQMKWSRQKPERKAVQRDEAAITRWRTKRWPSLKRYARRAHCLIVFIDESGIYLLPSLVRTWAPRGETPLLPELLTRDHISVISAVSRDGEVYSYQQSAAFDSETVIAFLDAMHRRLPDQHVLVIWDGAPIHRSKAIHQYLDDGASAWLRLERLPGYAPELNPDEGIWRYLKQVELRNVTAMSITLLAAAVKTALAHMLAQADLVLSFFRHAGLA